MDRTYLPVLLVAISSFPLCCLLHAPERSVYGSREILAAVQSSAIESTLLEQLGPLRLRGGGRTAAGGVLKQSIATQRGEEAVEMDVGDNERISTVKEGVSQRAAKSRLVLSAEQRKAAREDIEVIKLESVNDFVQFHAHAAKVVAERPKMRKEKGTPGTVHGDSVATMTSIKKDRGAVLKRMSINCTLASEHGLFNVSDLATYLVQRIKVNGQLHNLDKSLSVEARGDEVLVSAFRATQVKRKRQFSKKKVVADAFSTRYLRYLIKKFICKEELRDVVRCVSVDFSKAAQREGGGGVRFELRYTNMWKNRHLRLKMGQMFGSRLEAARRGLLAESVAEKDEALVQVPREEMFMERRVKATGERVGGLEWVRGTRRTLGEARAEARGRLRHWAALQERSYREPFGGAMRGWLDRSITRHDADRVGRRGKSQSTGGFTGTRALRSRSGVGVGLESLLYTGTAPHGIKGLQRRAAAQKLADRQLVSSARAGRWFSKAGEGDRSIYNFKPKHLFSGKMDLHKRDWR